MAMGEVYLAHDAQELFDHTAPYFFPKAETPFPFLRRQHGAGEASFRNRQTSWTRSRSST